MNPVASLPFPVLVLWIPTLCTAPLCGHGKVTLGLCKWEWASQGAGAEDWLQGAGMDPILAQLTGATGLPFPLRNCSSI